MPQILNENNFQSLNGILMLKISKPAVVLFKIAGDQNCYTMEHIITQLSQKDTNIQWCVVELKNNRDIVNISKTTSTPITYIPYILFYINGKPFSNYTGPNNIQSFSQYINEMIKEINKPRPVKSVQSQASVQKSDLDINLSIPKGSIPYNEPYLSYLKPN